MRPQQGVCTWFHTMHLQFKVFYKFVVVQRLSPSKSNMFHNFWTCTCVSCALFDSCFPYCFFTIDCPLSDRIIWCCLCLTIHSTDWGWSLRSRLVLQHFPFSQYASHRHHSWPPVFMMWVGLLLRIIKIVSHFLNLRIPLVAFPKIWVDYIEEEL